MKPCLLLLLLTGCTIYNPGAVNPAPKTTAVKPNLIPPPIIARAVASGVVHPPPKPWLGGTLVWDYPANLMGSVRFDVECRQSLTTGAWELLAGNLVTNSLAISNRAPTEFYRVGAHWL